MFVINSDNSRVSKIITVIFAVSALIGVVFQVASLLAVTKTKLGKKIRHNVISTMYDVMDESIDEASKRVPGLMKKIETIDQ